MANLDWRITIYPNGVNQSHLGSFDVRLRLINLPSQWKELMITFTIHSPQTQSGFVDLCTYKQGSMSKGWPCLCLSYKRLKLNLTQLQFNISIKLLKVTLNNNIIHHQTSCI